MVILKYGKAARLLSIKYRRFFKMDKKNVQNEKVKTLFSQEFGRLL
jgi:hypothetical protein